MSFLRHPFYTLLGLALCTSVAMANTRGTTIARLIFAAGAASSEGSHGMGIHSYGGGVHHK